MARRSKPYSLYEQKERRRRKRTEVDRVFDGVEKEIRGIARQTKRRKPYASRPQKSSVASPEATVGSLVIVFIIIFFDLFFQIKSVHSGHLKKPQKHPPAAGLTTGDC